MAIITIGILVVGMSSWFFEDTHRPCGNANTELQHFCTLPVSLYFSVMQTIYFTGALSVNFPSNLIAFWSNFAWMVGIIHIDSMQKWILSMRKDQQTHINAGAEPDVADLIYRLYYYPYYHYQQPLGKRFTTYGSPTQPGIPIPGSYYGFRSTLAASKITGANAFTTSGSFTLFTLACLVILYGSTRFATWIARKYILKRQEPTCSPFVCPHNFFAFMTRMIPLTYFHTLTMAFFEITHKEQHVRVEGGFGIAFPILYVGASVAIIVFFMTLSKDYHLYADTRYLCFYRKGYRLLPWWRMTVEENPRPGVKNIIIPIWQIRIRNITESESNSYIAAIVGRSTRPEAWGIVAVLFVYDTIRAAIYGAGQGHGIIQASLLLVVELLLFITQQAIRPYKSSSLHFIGVYAFGVMKVLTLVLLIPLAPRFNTNRIVATVMGIIVITLQGLMIVCLVCYTLFTLCWYLVYAFLPGALARCPPLRQAVGSLRNAPQGEGRVDSSSDMGKTASETTPASPSVCFQMNQLRRYPKIEDTHYASDNTILCEMGVPIPDLGKSSK